MSLEVISIDEFFASMSEEERTSYERAKKAEEPKVLGKIEIEERENSRVICYHRWVDHPTNYGVLICNKCGRENYNAFSS